MAADNGFQEKRRGDDRRVKQRALDFPFVDRQGILILEERRVTVDRRIELNDHTRCKQSQDREMSGNN